MVNNPPTSPSPERLGGLGRHVRTHALALGAVIFASAVGILASFAFQVLTARVLGAADFGLLAAFFVIVNVAAVGSSALQNSVTVQTAAQLAGLDDGQVLARRRRWPRDAIILGVGGGLVVAIFSPWVAHALATTPLVVAGAAATIPLSFVFADAVGLLQGSNQVSRAVWWSTLSQLFRVAFACLTVVVGVSLWGIIGAVLGALLVAVGGAAWAARTTPRPSQGVFSASGVTIIVLTVAFAWLTSSDVFFLRAGAAETLTGLYAAVSVLVKTGFLLPATLSLYLLPRFVRNRHNPQLSRVGVLVTLGVSVVTSGAMTLFFAVFGGWLVTFLYGSTYAAAAEFLVPASLAYLPWIAAQGVLIKVTSSASRGGAAVVVVVVLAQAVAFMLLLPNLHAMLVAYGALGLLVLASFLLIDLRPRRSSPKPS